MLEKELMAAVGTLADDLEEQISSFLLSHPDTVLIVVDTFQMVRGNVNDPSYGSDYQDMQKLKRIADNHGITILLVHHLRKQGDRDPVNRLSGTTGISGAVDAVFVLGKKERSQNTALLVCIGRDIAYRELELRFSKEWCVWDLVSDSTANPEMLLPPELNVFLEYMKEVKFFSGGNTELADAFNVVSGNAIEPKRLKQLMNCSKESLRELGVTFRSYRSNGQRLVEVRYTEPVTQVPQVTQKTGP
ncbi:MAG: AAA family ATPase [Faecousia sp.]